MATHSSSLAWKIPWTEEPGGLQSTGLQRSDTTEPTEHTHNPNPVFRKHKPHSGHRLGAVRKGVCAAMVREAGLTLLGLGMRVSAGTPASQSPGMPVRIQISRPHPKSEELESLHLEREVHISQALPFPRGRLALRLESH